MADPLSDRTVYVFTDAKQRVRHRPGHQLPYYRYADMAFTLDHTGKNLPAQCHDWTIFHEHQPHQEVLSAYDDFVAIRRGLAEKGWYVGELFFQASVTPIVPDNPVIPKFSNAADKILSELVEDRKRRSESAYIRGLDLANLHSRTSELDDKPPLPLGFFNLLRQKIIWLYEGMLAGNGSVSDKLTRSI